MAKLILFTADRCPAAVYESTAEGNDAARTEDHRQAVTQSCRGRWALPGDSGHPAAGAVRLRLR